MKRSFEASESELPPPPPLREFLEHTPGQILREGLVGAIAGGLVVPRLPGMGGDGGPAWAEPVLAALPVEVSLGGMVAGAVLAPVALLLTPLDRSRSVRALRYAGALAVSGMLLASFLGPGRERPLSELLAIGAILFVIGGVGHAFRVSALLDSGSLSR